MKLLSLLPKLLLPLACCCTTASGQEGATTAAVSSPAIRSVRVTRDVVTLHFLGDLWANTWADDDRLYLSWGDGTGRRCAPTVDNRSPGAFVSPWKGSTEVKPGCFHIPPQAGRDGFWRQFCRTLDCQTPDACYNLCPFTDSGLAALSGPVLDFAKTECAQRGDCVVARDLPTPGALPFPPNYRIKNDKGASLLSVGDHLYYAGFTPNVSPNEGYIAVSTDRGKTWTKAMGSPWTGASPFRVVMLINMGKNYELNRDGYAYALGTTLELEKTFSKPQALYLARVRKNAVAEYGKYEYLAALEGGRPSWSRESTRAIPLAGLSTLATGSAMYHAGIGRYLFLAGVMMSSHKEKRHGALFAAPNPWGPWKLAGEIPGDNISALIPKDAGPGSVFFTSAGGTETYELNIGRIDMQVCR
jgi:hypothetical protein